MATNKNFFDYITDMLSPIEEVTYRPMMGEYLIYYKKKLIGGIYDDRFLVKDTSLARKILPEVAFELPYEGAKPMLAVPETDDLHFLQDLFDALFTDLPTSKK